MLTAKKKESTYTAVESLFVPGALFIADEMQDPKKKICKCNKYDSEY
jgi:hypothetical protein